MPHAPTMPSLPRLKTISLSDVIKAMQGDNLKLIARLIEQQQSGAIAPESFRKIDNNFVEKLIEVKGGVDLADGVPQ